MGMLGMRRRVMGSNKDIFNGHEYVDMGEAGIWATCNVGANSPEEYGWYLAWGELREKTDYSWEDYKFGHENNLTKYNDEDRLTELQLEDDAAHVWMGGAWRMPTSEDFQKLITFCNTSNKTQNNVQGKLFTLKTDPSKQLFFPYCGNYLNSKMYYPTDGYYRVRNLDEDDNDNTDALYMNSKNCSMVLYPRINGASIRAFIPKT